MQVFRIVLNNQYYNKNLNKDINTILVATDIKNCLDGLINVEPENYNVIIPFNKENLIEIYHNSKLTKIETIVKKFFKVGREFSIQSKTYNIVNTEVINLIVKPRLLEGYAKQRINTYKTVNPIFYKNSFDKFQYTEGSNSLVDKEHFMNVVTECIKDELSSMYKIEKNLIELTWKKFNISFSKNAFNEKNNICSYGIFKTNCQFPLFLGDFQNNGFGKLHMIKNTSQISLPKVFDIGLKVPTTLALNLYGKDYTGNELKALLMEKLIEEVNNSKISNELKKDSIKQIKIYNAYEGKDND